MNQENDKSCNIGRYLERIGFKGEPRLDLETLNALQECHVENVPYENLEIMERKRVSLDVPSLYDKIVNRRRGGYCFELNGLYAWLLSELGFDVVQHFGRWLRGEPLEYPMRRHRILRVKLENKEYLCDVGVGISAPRRPLLLETDTVQEQNGESYRIVPDKLNVYTVQYLSSSGLWKGLYSVNDDPCIPIDYSQAHYYCCNHPESMFVNQTMLFIRTKEGYNAIGDVFDPVTGEKARELRQYGENGYHTTYIRPQNKFKSILHELFGIDLDG